MSYWFDDPHTLVLSRASIELRNPGSMVDYAQNRQPLSPSALQRPCFCRKNRDVALALAQ